MLKKFAKTLKSHLTRVSFGSTSAIITNLGLMAGLHSGPHARGSIIGGILIIAFADNISDSFGIHIFSESEKTDKKEVWTTTVVNFLSRAFVSLSFVVLLVILPLYTAIIFSIIWGLFLLAVISYFIAAHDGTNPSSSIAMHLLIAVAVIALSNIAGDFLIKRF
jgi:VIT1/CCC1 family predicted Fe2+/Mn2+ transporter